MAVVERWPLTRGGLTVFWRLTLAYHKLPLISPGLIFFLMGFKEGAYK